MSTDHPSNSKTPFENENDVLAEAAEMKKKGANNTQLRAFLEEHGMSNIVFAEDDIGKNPGTPPSKP